MNRLEDYQQKYIKFNNELNSFIYRLVNNRQEAEDISQNTYIKVFNNLDSFEEKSSFRTWVFSIALNLLKDSKRAQTRWKENWTDLSREYCLENQECLSKPMSTDSNIIGKFLIKEHINFCFNCIIKTVPLLNQISLLLKEVYQFKINEIMTITNLSEGKIKHAIAEARKDMRRIFKDRCSLINKKGVCYQCTELNNIYNPDHVEQIEFNKLKLVQESEKQNHEELLNIRIKIVSSIDPFCAERFSIHNNMMENCPVWAQKQESKQGKNNPN